jgi:hypothetical protein
LAARPDSFVVSSLAPRSSAGLPKHGVTAQFLENAGEYHRNYLNVDYWGLLAA